MRKVCDNSPQHSHDSLSKVYKSEAEASNDSFVISIDVVGEYLWTMTDIANVCKCICHEGSIYV